MYESMFETFLKTAHKNDRVDAEDRATVEAMKKLPSDVLLKIANGDTKLAYMCGPTAIGGSSGGLEWVEQFKDTPLFEQALGLEQQAIQIEQMEQQHRAQKDAERDQEPKFWEMQDRIRLQKRMLGLELASSQLQQASPLPQPTGGAMPPPAPMAEGAPAEAAAPPAPLETGSGAKVAFALTEKGHKFDTERAEVKKNNYLDEARLHQSYQALGHRDPDTGENPAKLLNVLRFGPTSEHPLAEARHQAYVGARHAQGANAWNPLGGLLTPLPEEQGATSGILSQFGRVGQKEKKAFDHASSMGRRMAQGDYDRAVALNSASEVGRELAKTAFSVTNDGHKFDVADFGAQRDMYGARREARSEYQDKRPMAALLSTVGAVQGYPSLGVSHLDRFMDAAGERHADYAAKQHGIGSNAWNPFGGVLTPTDREKKFDASKEKSKEKSALDASSVANLGRQAVGFLGKNPGAAVGTAVGAAGGLAHGLQKDQQGHRHLLRGAAEGVAGGVAGAALGQGAQHFGQAMAHRPAGVPLLQNIKDSAGAAVKHVGYQAQQAGGAIRDAVKPAAKPYQIKPGFTPPPATPGGGVPALPPSMPTMATRILPASGVAPTIPMSSAVPTRPMPPGRAPGQPSNIIGPMTGTA